MRIDVVCVGKIKEKFFREAVDEYRKRLSRYCSFRVFETADEPTPDHASAAEEQRIMETEGERLLKVIAPDAFVIALAINGKRFDSVGMADFLQDRMLRGSSHFAFVIGGSLGLSPKVLSRADLKMSFSDLTFPHQLMRVILAEQIYRCFRIISHEPYHK